VSGVHVTRRRLACAALAALVVATAVVVLADGSGRDAGAQVAAAPPNVVVIMTDDQRVGDMLALPRTASLLQGGGMTFANNFASYPLCCPSRATFLTGQYAHNHHVLSNVPPQGGYDRLDNSNTLPVWLKARGYHTAHVGKYLNGYGRGTRKTEIPPGWDDWQTLIDTSYYDYRINDNGSLVQYGSSAPEYQTDELTRRATGVIQRSAPAAAPFFLVVDYVAPHVEGSENRPVGRGANPRPPLRHAGEFRNRKLPRPASFNERDVSDKPRGVRDERRMSPKVIDRLTKLYRDRLTSLRAVDDGVVALMNALSASGELGNTYVFFTSDNGFVLGEHRLYEDKFVLYDESIRVPLMIRGPGIQAGARIRTPVTNADLAPTIVDAADATPGRVMDGRSLLPLMQDPHRGWRADVVIESARIGTRNAYRAIRTRRFIYARYASGEREMYDLRRDPRELQNIAGSAAYATARGELARRLGGLDRCQGGRCRNSPSLRLRLRRSGSRCVLAVRGRDRRGLKRVTFLRGSRRLARDETSPFRRSLGPSRLGAQVRARAKLLDGTTVALRRATAPCLSR
jgi:N-acetylglucosamine-6-sulfatase